MKIAMIGQKGAPATWGGIERHVEELGAALVERGHEVCIFTRPHYTAKTMTEWRGMKLASLPTLHTKHADAIVHSVLASFACLGKGFDVVHYHAIGPCLASPIARMRRGAVVATVHGQDWRGGKWGRTASAALRLGEWMALHVPDATIAVSESLASEYTTRAGRTVHAIPSGVAVSAEDDPSVFGEIGVERGSYLLFVGRIVPEKGLHDLIEALSLLPSGVQLVVAGDTSQSDEYVAALRAGAPHSVIFAGYRFGGQLAALYRGARLLVAPSTHEGLPIVILEAVAYGCPALVSDIPPMHEVLGSHGCYTPPGSPDALAHAISEVLADPSRAALEVRVRDEIVSRFGWQRVAADVEAVYELALGRG